MTAQFADVVTTDGVEYAMAGVDGTGLFEPEAAGLTPSAISSACWRGYLCWYDVDDGRLLLSRLVVGGRSTVGGVVLVPGADLLGRPAVAPAAESLWGGCLEVRDLARPVAFTGGLLLGNGFVRSTYVHMGFHPAWRYENVVELLLEDGAVRAVTDRSAAMAGLRQRIADGGAQDPDGARGGEAWVERTFTLDYSRSGLG